MKFAIPEISWHNRDPVLSVDFQCKTNENGPLRLATGGTDSHVLVLYLKRILCLYSLTYITKLDAYMLFAFYNLKTVLGRNHHISYLHHSI